MGPRGRSRTCTKTIVSLGAARKWRRSRAGAGAFQMRAGGANALGAPSGDMRHPCHTPATRKLAPRPRCQHPITARQWRKAGRRELRSALTFFLNSRSCEHVVTSTRDEEKHTSIPSPHSSSRPRFFPSSSVYYSTRFSENPPSEDAVHNAKMLAMRSFSVARACARPRASLAVQVRPGSAPTRGERSS